MRLPPPKIAALAVVSIAFLADTVLYYLLVPLLPSYARDLHLSQRGVSLLFGSYAAALLLSTFPLGRLADVVGRRTTMLWGLAGLGTTTLLFALSSSFPLLVAARVLQGVSAAATWTSGLALVADHFPASERGRAMGTVFAFANFGILAGPPLAGYLAERFGPRSPFLAAALLVLLDAAARAFLLRDAPEGARGEPGRVGTLLRDGTVAALAGAMVLGSSIFALLESVLPLDFDSRLGKSPVQIGIAFAVAAATHTVTSPLMGRLSDRVGRKRVIVAGLLATPIVLPLPALLPGWWGVLGAMALLGVLGSFLLSPVSPGLADAVERSGSRAFGSGFALLNLSYAAGMLLGPVAGGILVPFVGLPVALVAIGATFALYAIVVARSSSS